MVNFTYTVSDEHGIHARPAGLLVKQAKMFESDVTVFCGDRRADAKKIISVMSLGAKHGSTLGFAVSGKDEELAAAEILSFCRKNI